MARLADLKVFDLRKELEDGECDTTGRKAELQESLRDAIIQKEYQHMLWLLLLLSLAASGFLLWMNITCVSDQLTKATVKSLFQDHTLNNRRKNSKYVMEELESDDYRQLIDIKIFDFKINCIDACSNSKPFLLVLVTSAASNQQRRDIIRQTWGKKTDRVQVVFVLAAVDDQEVQSFIEVESQLFDDIIQGNFMDTYRNLTYKSVMALKYAIYHCPQATYILKSDDDNIVNMPLLTNYLVNNLSTYGLQNSLLCLVLQDTEPIRDNRFKWMVTLDEYPASKYPDYCQGPFVILSPDVMFKLYREAQKTPYLFLEDVFLYGIVAQKVNVVPSDISEFFFEIFKFIRKGKHDSLDFLWGPLGLSDDDLKRFWVDIMRRPVKCSIYDLE